MGAASSHSSRTADLLSDSLDAVSRAPLRTRLITAPFQPAVAAHTDPVEVIAADEPAVAVEVDAEFVAGPAPRTATLIREWREGGDIHRRGLHGYAAPGPGPCPTVRSRHHELACVWAATGVPPLRGAFVSRSYPPAFTDTVGSSRSRGRALSGNRRVRRRCCSY